MTLLRRAARRIRRIARAVERGMVRGRRFFAWGMLLAAVLLDVGAWLGVLAQNEPPVVLHLSTWAIIFTAVTTIFVAEQR